MDNHTSEKPESSGSPDSRNQLAFIREETRFEIGLLHERVNALVGAEAFLTIAFTAAMSEIRRSQQRCGGWPCADQVTAVSGQINGAACFSSAPHQACSHWSGRH
jgi:hypothetical protein